MKGTIFEKSTTSLQLRFYAMYPMASTRAGISAKRRLGLTYKTAWRMMNKIRNDLMNGGSDGSLAGDVEIDENEREPLLTRFDLALLTGTVEWFDDDKGFGFITRLRYTAKPR